MTNEHMPEWAKPTLTSTINILTGVKKCLNVNTPHAMPGCRDCPFYPWYDCYNILQEQLDELIRQEKEKSNGNS